MRRKPLFAGLFLIFIVSAAFSSVYLHPNITIYPVNTPDHFADEDTSADEDIVVDETSPALPLETDHSIASDSKMPPSDKIESESTISFALAAPTPEEIVTLDEAIAIPRTNFGFTLPGNIVNLASLNQIVLNRQLMQVDAVKTWHYIVSATTAALIFGGVMICLARFLSRNMLE